MCKVAYAKHILLYKFLLRLLCWATNLLKAVISFDQRCVVELVFQTSVLRLEESESHRVSICIFPVLLIDLVIVFLIYLRCVAAVEWSVIEGRCTLWKICQEWTIFSLWGYYCLICIVIIMIIFFFELGIWGACDRLVWNSAQVKSFQRVWLWRDLLRLVWLRQVFKL